MLSYFSFISRREYAYVAKVVKPLLRYSHNKAWLSTTRAP